MIITLTQLQGVFGVHRIRLNEPLEKHTVSKIDATSEIFFATEKIDELIKAVSIAKEGGMPVLVIGTGSRVRGIADHFDGLIIKNNCRKFDVSRMTGVIRQQKLDVGSLFLSAESGVILNQLVRFSIEEGLSGLEYFLGANGTVGGAIFENETYQEMRFSIGEVIFGAKILSFDWVQAVESDHFSFRKNFSSLKENQDILLSVIFKLTPMEKAKLWERGKRAVEYRLQRSGK